MAIRDFVIGFSITLLLILISILSGFDIVEGIYDFKNSNENWGVDEILLCVFWLGIFGVTFGIRRFRDIKSLNDQIKNLAFFDSVTNLPNRIYANERLAQLIAAAKRRNKEVAVLFLDFDRFKMVNDTYGHAHGDQLICGVGKRLLRLLRAEDVLARLGGDEFLILVDLESGASELNHLLMRLSESQNSPYKINDANCFVSFSIGISVYPKDGTSVDELLVAADSAMYKAKEKGKGLYQFYSSSIGTDIANRYLLEVGLKTAIEKQELYVQFQPVLDIKLNKVVSFEALLRWKFNGEMIPPELIIEVAEETNCIVEVGNWVTQQAFDLSRLHMPKGTKLAINVSVTQFNRDDFVQNLFKLIDTESFDSNNLILEITESAFLLDYEKAREKIIILRDAGISIAIDDFGTGHSSLGRLTQLNVDSLKIDRSFIEKMEYSETDKNVVKAIIALAKQLQLETVAEGIETEQQMQDLKSFDCDKLQGYYLGKPMYAKDIPPFITQRQAEYQR